VGPRLAAPAVIHPVAMVPSTLAARSGFRPLAPVRRGALTSAKRLNFDEGLQASEGFVPLGGNGIEIMPQVVNRTGIEDEATLATGARTADDSRPLQHAQVLGDGLARETRAVGELRDRMRLPIAELGEQRQPRLVAEGGENGRATTSLCKCTTKASA